MSATTCSTTPAPHPPALWGQERGRSAAAVPSPLPTNQPSLQHAPPPATILHDMFSTCVARGIAAKLVFKTVGGKVEMSLYCSTAAVSTSQKQGKKRPDNESRRLKRQAWIQRRASSRPGSTTAAAADTEFSECKDIPSGARAAAAAAVTTVRSLWSSNSSNATTGLGMGTAQWTCGTCQESPGQPNGVPRDVSESRWSQ
jgi:hypothetical protein